MVLIIDSYFEIVVIVEIKIFLLVHIFDTWFVLTH